MSSTKETKIIVKEVPVEITQQMAQMFRTITVLQKELAEEKKERLELKKDFEKLVSAVTKRGTEEIFKESKGIPESEREKFRLPERRMSKKED